MHCWMNGRPEAAQWRPMTLLSGGQQALACLALHFAIQQAYPSPFYFFDEVRTCGSGFYWDLRRHLRALCLSSQSGMQVGASLTLTSREDVTSSVSLLPLLAG